MSVQSEITRIQTAVSNSYTAVANKGGTVPASQVISNLPTAINSIDVLYQHNKDILNAYIGIIDLFDANDTYFLRLASQSVSNIISSINARGYYWSGVSTYVSNLISAGYTKVYNYDAGYWNEVLSGTTLSAPFCVPVESYLYCASTPADTLRAIYNNAPQQ